MRLWALSCFLIAGCASNKMSRDAADGASATAASEDDADISDDGGFADEVPASWELSGQIILDSDVVVEADSSLTIRLLTAGREVLCEAQTDVETATVMDAAQYPEDTLVGWWRVFVEGPDVDAESCFSDAYEFPVPVPMLLGVGPMHPEILAAAGADESLGELSGLNAAYASMDGGDTVWVFGVIGTEDAFSGTSGPEESAPLSDGKWILEPVYSFPL